jgi:hypothetical protein
VPALLFIDMGCSVNVVLAGSRRLVSFVLNFIVHWRSVFPTLVDRLHPWCGGCGALNLLSVLSASVGKVPCSVGLSPSKRRLHPSLNALPFALRMCSCFPSREFYHGDSCLGGLGRTLCLRAPENLGRAHFVPKPA